MTSLIMLFIRFVLRIPLRMSEEELLVGDDAIHGEAAYSLSDSYPPRSLIHGDTERQAVNDGGELGIIQGKSPANGDSDITPSHEKTEV